jgi:hypothetical protein
MLAGGLILNHHPELSRAPEHVRPPPPARAYRGKGRQNCSALQSLHQMGFIWNEDPHFINPAKDLIFCIAFIPF